MLPNLDHGIVRRHQSESLGLLFPAPLSHPSWTYLPVFRYGFVRVMGVAYSISNHEFSRFCRKSETSERFVLLWAVIVDVLRIHTRKIRFLGWRN